MLSPSDAPSTRIDATRIGSKLYQGGRPVEGHALRRAGFDVLVLCAMEHQPPARAYPGVTVIYAPLDDATITLPEWIAADTAAAQVVKHLARRRRVLVTCQQGRNRSGLVMALTLRRLTRAPGHKIVRHIQALRPRALTNDSFVAAIEALK